MPAGQNEAQPPNQDGIAEAQQPVPNEIHYFPGITLKFCVSDIGLKALELGCKLLRRITMNKISNHSPAQVNKKIVVSSNETFHITRPLSYNPHIYG